MESKEVIKGKIDILWKVLSKLELDNYPQLYDELKKEQLELQIQLLKNIEREAFEAGWYKREDYISGDMSVYLTPAFENYLKSKDSNN